MVEVPAVLSLRLKVWRCGFEGARAGGSSAEGGHMQVVQNLRV